MSTFSDKKIIYALLPYDGEFNIGPVETKRVSELIKAKYVIPIHGINSKAEDIKIVKEKERIELEP
ncbi:hypothetical protein [Clostridium sp. LP20]|uniref:hypothetical protein n=1 Tax=Clostridium sp. LP20 TaxID=3418665 RepID=UPI003EE53D85